MFALYSQVSMAEIAIRMNITCQPFSMWEQLSHVTLRLNFTSIFPTIKLNGFLPLVFRCMIQMAFLTGQWHMLIGQKESGIQNHTGLKIFPISFWKISLYGCASLCFSYILPHRINLSLDTVGILDIAPKLAGGCFLPHQIFSEEISTWFIWRIYHRKKM